MLLLLLLMLLIAAARQVLRLQQALLHLHPRNGPILRLLHQALRQVLQVLWVGCRPPLVRQAVLQALRAAGSRRSKVLL